MKDNCEHIWKKVERTSDDGLSYYYHRCVNSGCGEILYSMSELHRLEKYSEEHQFMFLEDWVFSFFYAMPDQGILEREEVHKQISYFINEIAPNERIRTEDIDHDAPHGDVSDEWISDIVEVMISDGVIERTGRKGSKGERFRLADEWRDRAKRSFDKLADDQKNKLVYFGKGHSAAADARMRSRVYSSDLGSTQALELKKIK
jgi:hypothetical protein